MWLLLAVFAQLILGASAVFDKLLLRRRLINAESYTFWLGILGFFALGLLPLGFVLPSVKVLLIALVAGATFIAAMYFYYVSLDEGEASDTLPIISGISPLATLGLGFFILGGLPDTLTALGFSVLIVAGIILLFLEPRPQRLHILAAILASVLLFGLSNVLSKVVFNQMDFVSGFAWIKVGGGLYALVFLLAPGIRKKIFSETEKSSKRDQKIYLFNRTFAAFGSFLVSYAVALSHPAIVDAVQSSKFIIIFFGAWLILKERFRGAVLFWKVAATLLVIFGISWLGMLQYMDVNPPDENREIIWGVTFSQKFSEELGLDWKENYSALLSELEVRHIRLPVYWDLVEREPGQYDFSDLDFQMKEAGRYDAKIIIAVGHKTPRWPECHYPRWAQSLSEETRDRALNSLMREIVLRYKDEHHLRYWQVENEPFLDFGECPRLRGETLDAEIALVKSLDPNHPILVTDSGEVSPWYFAAKRGDIFGTTMYRRVYHHIFGYVDYHFPPAFFRIKTFIVRVLTGDTKKRYIVSELAAEPWLSRQIYETEPEEQFLVFNSAFFNDTIVYAKTAGFDEYYLWGAEWWYWLGKKHNNWEMWKEAKSLF